MQTNCLVWIVNSVANRISTTCPSKPKRYYLYMIQQGFLLLNTFYQVSGGHRAPEAIQLLKEFYNIKYLLPGVRGTQSTRSNSTPKGVLQY